MEREELKLELERFADRFSEGWHEGIKIDASDIVLLSEAAQVLAQEQEPVSALWQHGETGRFRVTTPDSITDCDARWFKVGDLYLHTPQRTWVGLTDEEIKTICLENGWDSSWQSLRFAQVIEAKLKERNI